MVLKSIVSNLFSGKKTTSFEMIQERGNGFYVWNGSLYKSDIVRACIRPKVKAIGKLLAKHIRESTDKNGNKSISVNPEPYIRYLLEEPNPFMTGQKLLEKLAAQLAINSNAFAVVFRNENGFANEIYPVDCINAEAVYINSALYLKFYMPNGRNFTFSYSDIIHLKEDYYDNEIFGTRKTDVLIPLMEIVSTTDQGIVHAIKNSAVIRWLLKYNSSMRPEDIQQNAEKFAESFLSTTSKSSGVAAVDSKADAIQIEPKDYVPNSSLIDKNYKRILAFFNTNEKIITSSYSEDEWNSYYEQEIEPIALDLQSQFTKVLFSRRERGCGNRIAFEAVNLTCASISTKLNLLQMVDRGALTPNEWRAVFNLSPVDGGDLPIRRLDTAAVTDNEGR